LNSTFMNGGRPLIIAEVGVNHNGDPLLAQEMIMAAHAAGADCIKLQSFIMEDFFSPSLDYYEETASFALSFADQARLFEYAGAHQIPLITTPFDFKSVDFLDRFEVPAYKVASMDCDNYPLIKYIASRGKPVFISTGMASLGEIEQAAAAVREAGNDDCILLHCVSNYPTSLDEVNLRFMLKLREIFDCPVGFSDHTLGLESAMAAAVLGAAVLEKHFTTNRDFAKDFPGADHDISIVPGELQALRSFCEKVPVMLGSAQRKLSANEIKGRTEMRRGWYARKDILAGEILSLENLVALRPVRGVPVAAADVVLGRKASRRISSGRPLQYLDLDE
jgi:N,N'-diacetyllegionaminate synthase